MVAWVQVAGYAVGHQMSDSEWGYRKGFDQGFYFGLRAVGLNNEQAANGDYKRRLNNWRHARKGFSHHDSVNPPLPEVTEAEELQFFVAKQLANNYVEVGVAGNNKLYRK